MVTFTDTLRRHTNDRESDTSSALPTQAVAARESGHFVAYSRSKYPMIKYWTRQEWKEVESQQKGSSEVAGSRGGGRSSKGENVMTLYVETEKGESVSGTTAAYIRDFARSIWRGFYERGVAPKTWGQVSKDVQDEYIREMEGKWEELRYCEHHWKANHIATNNYSQWFLSFDKKKKGLQDNEESSDDSKPTGKKRRITVEDASSPPPKSPEPTLIRDIPSEGEEQGPNPATISRPRARPLRNPL